MAGSVIAACAFLLSIAAPSVQVLFFTYGIMGGIGFGMIYLPSIVSVGYYFSTKRAFATGLSQCGSGVGAFVFAPLTKSLLDVYDWKGALVIIAGLSLNCMVFGALMRPLKALNAKDDSRKRKFSVPVLHAEGDSLICYIPSKPSKTILNTEPGVQSTSNIEKIGLNHKEFDEMQYHSTTKGRNSTDVIPTINLSDCDTNQYKQKHEHSRFLQSPDIFKPLITTSEDHSNYHQPNVTMKTCRSQVNIEDFAQKLAMPSAMLASAHVLCPTPNIENYVIQRTYYRAKRMPNTKEAKKDIDPKDLLRPLYRRDIFYSGNVTRLPEFHESRNDVRAYITSVTLIPSSESSSEKLTRKKSLKFCPWKRIHLPKSMTDILKLNLEFKLFKEPSFALACVANLFGMMGFYIPFVYLTDSSIKKGVNDDHAAFLISVLGISNLFGKLIFGWIVDRPKVRAIDMNNLCLVVSGTAAAMIPFCYSYATIAIASVVFSLFAAAYISLISIVLVDINGLDKLTSSFGLLSIFRGIGSIIGPPIAGTVFDVTGSYDIPFFMAGGLLLLSASLTLLIPCFRFCRMLKMYCTKRRIRAPTTLENLYSNTDRSVNGEISTELETSI